MKKTITMLIILVSFIIVLSGCNKQKKEEDTGMKTKSLYAVEMRFNSNEGFMWENTDEHGNYRTFIFVNSEIESKAYGDDVIVAWPTESTEKILYNINSYVSDENIDIAPFSLAQPITMTDIVEKWENVNSLLDSFSISMQAYVLDPSHAYGYQPNED